MRRTYPAPAFRGLLLASLLGATAWAGLGWALWSAVRGWR